MSHQKIYEKHFKGHILWTSEQLKLLCSVRQLARFCVKMHQCESFQDSTDSFTFEPSVVNDLLVNMKPRRRWEWTRPRFYCRRSCLSCAWVSLCLETKTGFSDFSACPRGSRVALTFHTDRPGGYFARMFIKVWFCMGWLGRSTMAEKTTKGQQSYTWTRKDWEGLSPKGVIIREIVSRHHLCMRARLQQKGTHEFLMLRSQISRFQVH